MLVVPLDPVAIVVTRAGETDHPPSRHVAVAAIDRVGEEAVTRVLQQYLEKRRRTGPLQLHRTILHPRDDPILLAVRKLCIGLAGVVGVTECIERCEHAAIELRWCRRRLQTLLRR